MKDILKAGDSIQSLASDVQHRKQKETAEIDCRKGVLRMGGKRMERIRKRGRERERERTVRRGQVVGSAGGRSRVGREGCWFGFRANSYL